jgi:hypothetical protein
VCSQIATMHWLLWEMLVMVGRDVLQLAQVSLKMGRKKSLSAQLFLVLPLMVNTAPPLNFCAVPSLGRG